MSGTLLERGGVASVQIDGTIISVGADIGVKIGGIVNTPKISSNGVAGYTTKWEAPEITLTAIDGPQTSVLALKSVNGQTLQVVLNNGKSYLLSQAFTVDDPSVKVEQGDISGLKFSGSACTEVLA